jgi:hypothetical protein
LPLQFREAGREIKTPAQQAGLVKRAMTWREVFSARIVFLAPRKILFVFVRCTLSVRPDDERIAIAA